MYQLAGRNLDRASAATDMIGRAAVPADRFDVTATPRGGRGIEQRLVMSFTAVAAPATATPRATLAPAADAFVAGRLGALDGVTVRLLDGTGDQVASTTLGALGVSALDIAADAAAPAGMNGAFPLLLTRSRAVTGIAGAAIGVDPSVDGVLIDLLAHAAAWHRALAGRAPLDASTFTLRADGAASVPTGPLDAVHALATALATAAPTDPAELALWGIAVAPGSDPAAEVARRVAATQAATDAVSAAKALFGSDAVTTGEVADIPAPIATTLADQAGLGTDGNGAVDGWLQDTARVRAAARDLDEAVLLGELDGLGRPPLVAGQTPSEPYVDAVAVADARRWVGLRFPADLGRQPALSVVVAGPAATPLIGLELDAWAEVVPDTTGAGAVAANLTAPDARAPNTILLAVPADVSVPWTRDALFSVVDEAIELAACRLVDLDASKRAPALLPAVYVADFDDSAHLVDTVRAVADFPNRYVERLTP